MNAPNMLHVPTLMAATNVNVKKASLVMVFNVPISMNVQFQKPQRPLKGLPILSVLNLLTVWILWGLLRVGILNLV